MEDEISSLDNMKNAYEQALLEKEEAERALSNMNLLIKAHVKELKEKDATIAEYKEHYDSHIHKISNLDEHLDSALKELGEKDAEIERLKEWNKDIKNFLESKIEDYLE